MLLPLYSIFSDNSINALFVVLVVGAYQGPRLRFFALTWFSVLYVIVKIEHTNRLAHNFRQQIFCPPPWRHISSLTYKNTLFFRKHQKSRPKKMGGITFFIVKHYCSRLTLRFTKSAKSLPFSMLLASKAKSINCLTRGCVVANSA